MYLPWLLSSSEGYRCYCPSLWKYLVSDDVTFLKNTPFSPDLIHTSPREDDDLLVYTLALPAFAYVPPLTKPPITQVYARRLHPSVLSPPPAASTTDPVLSDDLPIALRKVNVLIQSLHFVLITICHPILVRLLHHWTLFHCLTKFLKP